MSMEGLNLIYFMNQLINMLLSLSYCIYLQNRVENNNLIALQYSAQMPQLQNKLMQLLESYLRSKQVLYAKELALVSKKKIVKLDEVNSKTIQKICRYCQSIIHQYYCKVQTHSRSSKVKLCVKCTYQLLTQCNCQISSYLPYLSQQQEQKEAYNPCQNSQVDSSMKSNNQIEFPQLFSEMQSVDKSFQQFSNYQVSQPESQVTNKCLKQFANTFADQFSMKQHQPHSPQPHTQIQYQLSPIDANHQILSRIHRLYSKTRTPQPINRLKIVISIFEFTSQSLTPKYQLQAKLMTFFCEKIISRTINKTYLPNDIIAKKQIMLIYNCWIQKVKQYLKDEKNTILRECPNRDSTFCKKITSIDQQLSAVNENNKRSWYFHGLTRNPQNWNRLISRLKNDQYDFSSLPVSNEPCKSGLLRIRLPK